MFTVIYTFRVKPGKEKQFSSAWSELTSLIYQYEGSLGSRLHLDSNGLFLAYAQWPTRSTWENAGSKLPSESEEIKSRMRDACEEIKTVHELDVLDDLLYDKVSN